MKIILTVRSNQSARGRDPHGPVTVGRQTGGRADGRTIVLKRPHCLDEPGNREYETSPAETGEKSEAGLLVESAP